MINTNNNVIPLTWKELRDGYKYLHSKNLKTPCYEIKLYSIDNCLKNDCYFNKINLLPKYDNNSHKPLTTKINHDFIDMNICSNHILPPLQTNIFDNHPHEISYLMSASSLVKLINYDYTNLLRSCLEIKALGNKKNNKITLDKVLKKVFDKMFNRDDTINNKDKINIYNNARLGLLTNIYSLNLTLDYAIDNEIICNSEVNIALELVINEFINIYKDFNQFYIYHLVESNKINDADKLHFNFDNIARESFLSIINQLKNEINIPINEVGNEIIMGNYESIKANFIKYNNNFTGDNFFVVLKSKPDQNTLLSHGYNSSKYIKTYLCIKNTLFPKYEKFYEQVNDNNLNKRFIAKISFYDYYILKLYFDDIIESNIYFENDKSTVIDATVLWSSDPISPYYFFDEAFRVVKNL